MSKPSNEILLPKPEAHPRICAYSIADKAHAGFLKVVQTTHGSPQRGILRKPRATPWEWHDPMNQALKGRPNGNRHWIAPSGLEYWDAITPRALPWAGVSRPVGAGLIESNLEERADAANEFSAVQTEGIRQFWHRIAEQPTWSHYRALMRVDRGKLQCPKGATQGSLGQRPRFVHPMNHEALKGRPNRRCLWIAPSGLEYWDAITPRALPWAGVSRPVGAGLIELNLEERADAANEFSAVQTEGIRQVWHRIAEQPTWSHYRALMRVDRGKLQCPKGATQGSLGQRPRIVRSMNHEALKGRPNGNRHWIAITPRALPWASVSRPIGAGLIELNLEERADA